MTYPATSPQVRYTATAGQTLFNGTFKIFTQNAVNVYKTLAGETPDPVNDLLTLNTDYTIAISGDGNTFEMTLTLPALEGDIITMFLAEPYQKLIDLKDGGADFSSILNDVLDKITALAAQNNAILKARGLTYSEVEKINSGQTTIPKLPPHYFWKANADGNIQAVFNEEDPDSSTLRSEIENRSQTAPGTDVSGAYIGEFGGGQSLTQALNDLFDKNRYLVTGGSSTLYTGSINNLSQYYDGLSIPLTIHVTNGAAPALSINGLSATPIVDQNGNALIGGEMPATSFHRVNYVGGKFYTYTTIQPASSEVRWNYRSKQIIYQDATDPTRNIGVTAGEVADSTNQVYIKLLTNKYKQTNAAWTEGDGQGGMASGLLPLSEGNYKAFVLLKTSNPLSTPFPVGTVEVGFDTAENAANLIADASPYGYQRFRYVGGFYLNASLLILDFKMNGNTILFNRGQTPYPFTILTNNLTDVDLIYTPTGRQTAAILQIRTLGAPGVPSGSFSEIILGEKITDVVDLDDRNFSNIFYVRQGSTRDVDLLYQSRPILTDLARTIQFKFKTGSLNQLRIDLLGYYDFIND